MGILGRLKYSGKAARKGLAISLFWLFCVLLANAAQEYTVETIPNVRLTNRLNHVSNPDGILLPDHVARINAVLGQLEDSLGIEVAVVAVESIGDNDARMFATDLFKHWGIGKKGEDNGLLIQLVTEPSQRSVVFETGYGIEGILPDAICYRLQQRYMIPDLKAGNYSEGMLKGVIAVSRYLLESGYTPGQHTGQADSDGGDLWLFGFLSVAFLVVVFLGYYFQYRPRRCPRCGQKSFVYMGTNVIVEATHYREGLEEKIYRCKKCGYTERHERRTDRLHSGGGPIIMGGGGFGGFGGGSGGSWGGGSSGGGGSMSRF